MKLGRVDEGRSFLEKFQSLSAADRRQKKLNSQLWPLLRSGVEAVEERREDEALLTFEEALELAPEEAPPYLYLAEFHLGRGKPAEAESVLLKGLELLPDNVHLHKLLIKVYVGMGDEAGAERQRRHLEELVKRHDR